MGADVARGDAAVRAKPLDQCVNPFRYQRLQPLAFACECGLHSADHVRGNCALRVGCRCGLAQRLPLQIHQPQRKRGGADIHRETVSVPHRLTGEHRQRAFQLDIDEVRVGR